MPPGVSVETKHEDYAISGASAEAMRSDLARRGPKDDGGSHHAFTRWFVRWSYLYDRRPGTCALTDVKVTVAVTFIMPDWTAPPEAPPDLVARWNQYRTRLQRHEDGHREHGLAAAKDVLNDLRKLPAASDRDAMNRRANTRGNDVLEKYKRRDKDYDRDTRHGATQGARFP